uniref:Uncharacterized protein n=1 Tax=Salmo trutta TaxID=8032 RepID=A0A673XPP7_SALTR
MLPFPKKKYTVAEYLMTVHWRNAISLDPPKGRSLQLTCISYLNVHDVSHPSQPDCFLY